MEIHVEGEGSRVKLSHFIGSHTVFLAQISDRTLICILFNYLNPPPPALSVKKIAPSKKQCPRDNFVKEFIFPTHKNMKDYFNLCRSSIPERYYISLGMDVTQDLIDSPPRYIYSKHSNNLFSN